MAEPLKNMYNEEFLRHFGEVVQSVYKIFGACKKFCVN